jgi:hypothetical protein
MTADLLLELSVRLPAKYRLEAAVHIDVPESATSRGRSGASAQ